MRFWNPSQAHVKRILTDCCMSNVCATVISPESGIVRQGMFRQLDQSYVTVRFVNAESSPLLSEALCCVAFQYRNRPRMFYTSILGVADNAFREIRLALPEDITSAERRLAGRVPVVAEAAVGVLATLRGGKCITAVAVDVSLAGLLAEVSATDITHLTVGLNVTIKLTSPRGWAEIPAKVSRLTKAHCGFAFERESQQRAAWLEDLGTIVKHVENALIERKYGGKECQNIGFSELFACSRAPD